MNRLPRIFGEGRTAGIAVVAALAVGQAVAAGVAAFATRDVFAAFGTAGAPLPTGALVQIVAAGAVIAILRVAERTVGEGVGQRYAASLRAVLFRHLARMPARALARRRAGGLAIRFVGDLAAVRSWISLGVTRMISAAIILPGAITALLLLDPRLAAAAAAPLALSVLAMAILAPRLAPLHRRLRSRRARLAADMTERIPLAPELRLLGRDRKEIRRLDRRALGIRAAAVARARVSATLRAIPEIGALMAGVVLLGTAFASGAGAAEAAASLAVLSILTLPLRDLAGVWDRRRAWEVARDKCQAVLDAPTLEAASRGEAHLPGGPASLVFDAVSAGPLRRVGVRVEPGQTVAIVGGNGTGKSTLLALAAGLENPGLGRVSIDGIDVSALSPDERRRTIAYVGPRSPILKGSLRRALTLGITPRPNDAEIDAAARACGLGNAIERLGGLDGSVSEGGRNLSSGEARRVHLVRATLARPRLLLLDEPDDALDGNGRASLRQLVTETPATLLIVTHDLCLARQADVIWYVESGAIPVAGAPDVLLLEDGPVARFFHPRQVA